MKLSKSLTKVTPFSRRLALVIFTAFPILGFFLGTYYQQSKQQTPTPQEITRKVYLLDTPRRLIERCGDIPNKVYPKNTNRFDVIKTPAWSPDCRHIAYSLWESGTSYPIEDLNNQTVTRKLSGREGVFVYSDADQTTKKIYNPLNIDETPTFIEWQDRENLIYSARNQKIKYNIITQEELPL